MFNFDLDYRRVKEEVVKQPALKKLESDGGASCYPDADETTTFIHAKVPF